METFDPSRRSFFMRLNFAWTAFFWLGLLLLALNTAGLFIPARNPEIYRERLLAFKDDITLTEAQLWTSTIRQPDETNEAYVVRLTDLVNKGMANYWDDQGVNKYRLRVPAYENYLLFLASYLHPRGLPKI